MLAPEDTCSCHHPKHWRECRAPGGCECRKRGPNPRSHAQECEAIRTAAKAVVAAWDEQGYIGNDYLIAGVAPSMRALRDVLEATA